MSDRDPIVPDEDNRLDNEATQLTEEPNDGGKRSLLALPRLLLIAGGAILVVAILLVLFSRGGSESRNGPTLTQQLQQQSADLENYAQQLRDLQAASGRYNQALQDQTAAAADQTAALTELRQEVDELKAAVLDDGDPQARIGELTQRLDELASSVDVRFAASLEQQQGLEASVDALRSQRAAVQRASSSPSAQQTLRREAPPSPPFSISGYEQRAGRSYLAIAPQGAAGIHDVRLLGEGESIGPWRLSAVNGGTAVFNINGQSVAVPVP